MSRQCTLKSLSDFILIKICNVFYSRRSNDICKSLHINTMYESQMRSPNKVNSCCSILVTNVNKESIPHFKKMAFRIFYDCVTPLHNSCYVHVLWKWHYFRPIFFYLVCKRPFFKVELGESIKYKNLKISMLLFPAYFWILWIRQVTL